MQKRDHPTHRKTTVAGYVPTASVGFLSLAPLVAAGLGAAQVPPAVLWWATGGVAVSAAATLGWEWFRSARARCPDCRRWLRGRPADALDHDRAFECEDCRIRWQLSRPEIDER